MTTKTTAGRMIKMIKLLDTIKNIWSEMEPVAELFIYMGIAKLLTVLFGISFLQAVTIVYTYFVLNLARIGAEILRAKYK